jgi:hypothetical protein
VAKSVAYMASAGTNVEQFQRMLVRHGVGTLEADRHRCADCGRSPLIGEVVHLYEGRSGGVICELCRQLRREAPVATASVRHSVHGHAVRLTARAA